VPRVALTREEAAASIGVSLSTFERWIQPELRIIYAGSTRLVPIRELEAWVERTATIAGDNTQAAPATRQRPGA
jgi:excisionase family DNA binding protein